MSPIQQNNSSSGNIIIVQNNLNLANLFAFSLQSEFNFETFIVQNEDQLMQVIGQVSNIAIVIFDAEMFSEFFSTFHEKCNQSGLKPLYFYNNVQLLSEKPGEILEHFQEEISSDQPLENLNSHIHKYFKQDESAIVSDYCKVSVETLRHFDGPQKDIYIRLKSGKLIKLFTKEDRIDTADVNRYLERGVKFFYLKQQVAKWILKTCDSNIDKTLETFDKGEPLPVKNIPQEFDGNNFEEVQDIVQDAVIDGSPNTSHVKDISEEELADQQTLTESDMSDGTIDDHQLELDNESNQLAALDEDFDENIEKTHDQHEDDFSDEEMETSESKLPEGDLDEVSIDDLPDNLNEGELEEVSVPNINLEDNQEELQEIEEPKFDLEGSIEDNFQVENKDKDFYEAFSKSIHHKVVTQLKTIKKAPKLSIRYLQKLNLDRSSKNYYHNHILLLNIVACGIAKLMEWKQEATLYKIIFVSYISNIALSKNTYLAPIQTVEELKKIEEHISPEDKDLILQHPVEAANFAKNLPHCPADADKIILQHHERPNGSGFPQKLNSQKIIPLAAMVIVAIDFTDYILKNPQWNMKNYVTRAKKIFSGANFRKVTLTLEKIR